MDPASLFFIHNYHGYILQIFIAEMLFLPLLRRRSRFLLRLLIAFLPFALLSIVLTNLLAMRVNGLASITIFLLSLGLQIAIYESKVKDILFCCVGAMLIQNLSHNIEQLFYLPFKENFNDVGWFFLSVGVMVAVYALAYILIVYPQPKGSEINITSRSTLIIAASSALFCYLIHTLFTLHGLSDHWISALPFILVDLLALALSFGLVSYRNKKEENQELERSIAKVHHYYAFMRDNIDILNMKAHDLKHFIRDAREKIAVDSAELEELQKTVEDYETIANTGSQTLDYILTEKRYLCQKEGISFTFSADGKALSFLSQGDLISLFGNLLSNAVEAEEKLADKDKAYIFLAVSVHSGMTSIHLENYYPEEVVFENGIPLTTKEDRRFHGFGSKSIRYIVKKYGGTYANEHEQGIFEVNILFPQR